jgi:putative hydrolase of the HAD superfamily
MSVKRPSKRALLIDFDGVLRHWGDDARRIEIAHGIPEGAIGEVAFASANLVPAITGRVSDEQWRTGIAAQLGAVHGTRQAAAAVGAWSALRGTIDSAVVALLNSCNVPVVLVSNATTRLESDLESLGLAGLFASVVNSSRIGVAKPSQGLFLAALARAGVSAQEALFVDDSPDNVCAAAELGFESHRYTSCPELQNVLRRCGMMRHHAH